jgi:asparagine synthase (glutamine-hydrolysing)
MCGIAGLIRYSGLTRADHSRAARLRALLHHRGPDGAGIAITFNAAVVQTRLALVALEPHPLPLQSACGRYTLAYNGELYNHGALRRELQKTHKFLTETDTEVVLAALLRWGPAALARFEGMFAFFLWDGLESTGLAAVDPLSVKPLLYHSSETQFAFCSEAAPLFESGLLPFRPHDEAIAEYLAAPYFSSSHLLPFANLQRLLPGHFLELAHGRATVVPYNHSASAPPALLPALRHAVASHAAAAAPVGLFLSGGVDSSLLAALAPRPLPAFTIQYPNHPDQFRGSLIVNSDDVPFARQAAALFHLPHTIVRPVDFATALERTCWTNDLIAAWEQEVSQNLLAEAAAKQKIKAVLVGDAADETHYGYSFLLHPERLASPSLLLEHFGSLPTRVPQAHFVEKYLAFTHSHGHSWRSPDDQRMALTCLIRHFWLTRLLHNGDLHLMAHGVEGRVPFAHPAVLAYAAQVPLAKALKDGIEKHHLRLEAATVLPPEFAWRPKSALTKHLGAARTIHTLFRKAWSRHGALLEPYVYADRIEALPVPGSDRETGLRFRLFALLTWFARFADSQPA